MGENILVLVPIVLLPIDTFVEDEDDNEAVVPVPAETEDRVGGVGGKSPISITLGVSKVKVLDPNMIY